MIQRMVTSAVFAGVAAGLFAALLHFAFVQKYLLLGEDYESGAAVHFGGVASAEEDHDTGAAIAAQAPDHAGNDGDGENTDGTWQRNGLTVLFFALLYAAYGLLLVAGFALAQHFGQRISAREGILWGIAGFVCLHLAPALGLAPQLPGTAGAALTDRQLWWGATVICTAGGLALLRFGHGLLWALLAVVLLALPHLIGAPEPEGFSGVAPPEVAAAFATRSLAVGLAAWSLLGWMAARLWDREPA